MGDREEHVIPWNVLHPQQRVAQPRLAPESALKVTDLLSTSIRLVNRISDFAFRFLVTFILFFLGGRGLAIKDEIRC